MLITIPQAAQSLGISRAKLYLLLAQQKGPPVIRFGRSVRISIDSLQQWIKEQETHLCEYSAQAIKRETYTLWANGQTAKVQSISAKTDDGRPLSQ
ncbi:helix-turn-helix transcriptional regulator [Dictyobacter formicarum]|uniref:helix-turn-helix transcriptional regulator n=1 Tax=Dictyobacter formicarum TaxID=2778368 RepID=UPI001914EB6B